MEIDKAKHWIKNVVLVVFAFIIAGLFLKNCGKEQEIQELKLDAAEIDQRFIARIKADSSREYVQNQLLSSERNAKILAQDKLKQFKNYKSVVKYKTEYVHDTIFAAYTDIDTIYSACAIPCGTEFAKISQYDTIRGKVDSLGITIYPHITDLGTTKVIIANEKIGWLKLRSHPVVSVTFSNPNIRAVGLQNVVVEPKKPKRGIWLATGLVAGLIGGILLIAH